MCSDSDADVIHVIDVKLSLWTRFTVSIGHRNNSVQKPNGAHAQWANQDLGSLELGKFSYGNNWRFLQHYNRRDCAQHWHKRPHVHR